MLGYNLWRLLEFPHVCLPAVLGVGPTCTAEEKEMKQEVDGWREEKSRIFLTLLILLYL